MYRYPPPGSPPEQALHVLFAGVAFAAGLTGVLLLILPASTERYFSWGLEPPPLAALIGGSYVASLIVFGHASRRFWREGLGLAAGTLALTIPMIVVTFAHLDTFDFSRWQAWGWVVLFLVSPVAFGFVLVRGGALRRPRVWRVRRPLIGLAAALLTTGAIALWVDPGLLARGIPFELPPLGGRVLGCWMSFLAFLCWWSAFRSEPEEVAIPLEGVTLFGIGALLAAARTAGDLESGWVAYVSAWLVITLVAAWEWVKVRGAQTNILDPGM
jgi:hypothetical protein